MGALRRGAKWEEIGSLKIAPLEGINRGLKELVLMKVSCYKGESPVRESTWASCLSAQSLLLHTLQP
jgi:hypothetical protein